MTTTHITNKKVAEYLADIEQEIKEDYPEDYYEAVQEYDYNEFYDFPSGDEPC